MCEIYHVCSLVSSCSARCVVLMKQLQGCISLSSLYLLCPLTSRGFIKLDEKCTLLGKNEVHLHLLQLLKKPSHFCFFLPDDFALGLYDGKQFPEIGGLKPSLTKCSHKHFQQSNIIRRHLCSQCPALQSNITPAFLL